MSFKPVKHQAQPTIDHDLTQTDKLSFAAHQAQAQACPVGLLSADAVRHPDASSQDSRRLAAGQMGAAGGPAAWGPEHVPASSLERRVTGPPHPGIKCAHHAGSISFPNAVSRS